MLKKRIIESVAKLFPLFVEWCKCKFDNDNRWLLRKEILAYYRAMPYDKADAELAKALSYTKKKGIHIFPYSFIEKYDPEKAKVYTDQGCGLKYVLHNGYKLYFERGMNNFRV